MDYKKWQKLRECMKNNETLCIEVCNNYGESGVILGKISKNILNDKRSYAFYFDVQTKKGKMPIMLDMLLERPVIMHDALFGKKGEMIQENIDTANSFNVLRIFGKDGKTIYKNPDEKTLLKFPVNSKNFNANSKQNTVWREKESTKFLLDYIGQYVEVKQDDEVYGGILKSVYKPKSVDATFVELIESSNIACIKPVKHNTKINIYVANQRAKSYVYKEKSNLEESVKDL